MLKLISWNIAHQNEPWRALMRCDADIALLQEAAEPPDDAVATRDVSPGPWRTSGGANRPWRTAVVDVSRRAEVDWLYPKSIDDAQPDDLSVSRLGTLAAAVVTPVGEEPIIVASMYGLWETPHPRATGRSWRTSADASVHRVISDLSALVARKRGHRIIAAGDLNILYGYGDHGEPYWASRYDTVFSRMSALGLTFVGPQFPGGEQAFPRPDELPHGSKNVPTYRKNRNKPQTATRQVDFVFASRGLSRKVRVTALNAEEDWGPSDHCRVEIEVA